MTVPPGPVTCGEVLNDAGRRCVEDDVSAIIQVVQVIATVKSSVAKHVVESQLLHSHTKMKVALRRTSPHLRNSYMSRENCMVKQATTH